MFSLTLSPSIPPFFLPFPHLHPLSSSAQVRILDNEAATGAVPRVMIEFTDTQTGRRC